MQRRLSQGMNATDLASMPGGKGDDDSITYAGKYYDEPRYETNDDESAEYDAAYDEREKCSRHQGSSHRHLGRGSQL